MCSAAMKPIALGVVIGSVTSVGAIRLIAGYFQGLAAAAPVAVVFSGIAPDINRGIGVFRAGIAGVEKRSCCGSPV